MQTVWFLIFNRRTWADLRASISLEPQMAILTIAFLAALGLGWIGGSDLYWLEMIRAHRPDLSSGRSESEILELRRDPKLAREITARFAERNAATLRQRGLPVTAGTVYLAHFAGGAGAVAILSAPENAEAAPVMAKADATVGPSARRSSS